MKLRLLVLPLPLAALAVGYLAWQPGGPGTTNDAGEHNEALSLAAAVAFADDAPRPRDQRNNPSPLANTAQVGSGCEMVTRYLPRGDGTVQEVFACESINAVARHPYESYSNAALASLAYADAKAAEILGMRISGQDEAKAISLIFRSAALSGGDAAPILLYSQSYPHPSAVDGVPVRKTVHTQFVLAAVADLLGANAQLTATWEETIRRYASNPDAEIALLRTQAVRIVEEMRQIQQDVSGDATIGGQGDA